MTALVKLQSRGIVLAQSVSAVYVALAGLQSLEITGEKTETNDTRTLDGPVHLTKDPTGYTEAATIKASGFYDPGHATYTALKAIINAPTTTNFKVTYTDSAPTSDIYPVTGVGVDKKAEGSKQIMADIVLETSGDPS